VCTDEQGEAPGLPADSLEPALDRVWVNSGGRTVFWDSGRRRLNLPYGRGLGLVVADFMPIENWTCS